MISAEANAYMSWQAKLAHYSCLSRLGHPPLVVVHELEPDGFRDLQDIRRTGGTVCPGPSYRVTSRGFSYPPRNTAGTLLEAARLAGPGVETLVLCDPDVVFARRSRFGRDLSAARSGYLDYEENPVRGAMDRLGIAPADVARYGRRLHCGIPYVIPRSYAEPLARAWLEAIDAFDPPRWEDVMHAFGLAVIGLGLSLEDRPLADTNYDPDAPVRAPVVHYCYDNDAWTKRRFFTPDAAKRVWRSSAVARPGSVLAEVLRQLGEARRFFAPGGLAWAARRRRRDRLRRGDGRPVDPRASAVEPGDRGAGDHLGAARAFAPPAPAPRQRFPASSRTKA